MIIFGMVREIGYEESKSGFTETPLMRDKNSLELFVANMGHL